MNRKKLLLSMLVFAVGHAGAHAAPPADQVVSAAIGIGVNALAAAAKINPNDPAFSDDQFGRACMRIGAMREAMEDLFFEAGNNPDFFRDNGIAAQTEALNRLKSVPALYCHLPRMRDVGNPQDARAGAKATLHRIVAFASSIQKKLGPHR